MITLTKKRWNIYLRYVINPVNVDLLIELNLDSIKPRV